MNDRRDLSRIGKFALDGRVFVGEVRADVVHELDADSMTNLILGEAGRTGDTHPLDGLRLLPPVDRPSKIICIGLNYRSHIREMGWKEPETPIIFSKPSSALIGPGEDIVLPAMSHRVDYEGETAIVMGSQTSHAANGLEHVFGYTALNDVTARDLQEGDPDWTRAKGFDTFAPIGPFISTKPPSRVTTRVNGKVVQDAPTSDRVFGDAHLVEYISSIMTLNPGDVIATGTPSGISPLKAGDSVEVEVDGVGVLRNGVVSRTGQEQE